MKISIKEINELERLIEWAEENNFNDSKTLESVHWYICSRVNSGCTCSFIDLVKGLIEEVYEHGWTKGTDIGYR